MLAGWATRMGQDLFYPPNVGGWAGGRSWLSSRGMIARMNFATALAFGNELGRDGPRRRGPRSSRRENTCGPVWSVRPRASWTSRTAT